VLLKVPTFPTVTLMTEIAPGLSTPHPVTFLPLLSLTLMWKTILSVNMTMWRYVGWYIKPAHPYVLST